MKKKCVRGDPERKHGQKSTNQGKQAKRQTLFWNKVLYTIYGTGNLKKPHVGENIFLGALRLLFQIPTLSMLLTFIACSYGTSSCSSTGAAKWGRGSKQKWRRKPVPVTFFSHTLSFYSFYISTIVLPLSPPPASSTFSLCTPQRG